MSTLVLYIAGTGRSGSTVLANILGEVDGVFAAGEVRYLWQRGLKEDRLCGCGLPVRECPVWSKVLALAGELDDPARVDGIVSMLQRTGRIRNLPGVLAGSVVPRLDPGRVALPRTRHATALRRPLRRHRDGHRLPGDRQLVEASGVRQRARCDAWHRPPGRAPHPRSARVRRTRGRATRRLRDGAARSHMEQIGPAKSAVLWDVWNLAGGVLFKGGPDRYLRLRYEDFVADPRRAVRSDPRDGRHGGRRAALRQWHTRRAHSQPQRRGQPGPPSSRADHAAQRRSLAQRNGAAQPAAGERAHRPAAAALRISAAPGDRQSGRRRDHLRQGSAGEGTVSRITRRVRRHLRWGRTEGFSRLVEEDELNPVTRVRVAAAKWDWRRTHPQAGRARHAGLPRRTAAVGDQHARPWSRHRARVRGPQRERSSRRSTTSCSAMTPSCVASSWQASTSTCSSSRSATRIVSTTCSTRSTRRRRGRAIWAYRDVDGRVRSAVSKFGRNNLLDARATSRPATAPACGKRSGSPQATLDRDRAATTTRP